MSQIIKSEAISRRRALSLFGTVAASADACLHVPTICRGLTRGGMGSLLFLEVGTKWVRSSCVSALGANEQDFAGQSP
jgi:hypothetical protein